MCPLERSRTPYLNRSAFTLIEILLVVVLVSLLSGLTVVRFNQSHRSTILKQCADVFVSQIQFAKQFAVLSNQRLFLKIDAEKKLFHVTDSEGKFLPSFGEQYPSPYLLLSSKLTVEADPETIQFDPTGPVDSFQVRFKDGKRSLLCENKDLSGKVKITEEAP